MTLRRPIPSSVLPGESRQRNGDVAVAENETSIEICKTEERLNVFDFPGDRPVNDYLNLFFGHPEALRRKDVAEEFDRGDSEFTLVRIREQTVFSKTTENFADMFAMFFRGVRVDEKVVHVNDNIPIKYVAEDIVDEALECRWSVSETEGHNIPFEGTVTGPEGSFPFVSSSDANEVKCVLEVYLSINFGFSGSVKEVCEERKRVTVLSSDLVQPTEVDAEPEGSVLLRGEKDGRAMRRIRRRDKSVSKVFIEEFAKCFQLFGRERVETSKWGFGAFLNVDLKVVGSVFSKRVCFHLIEHVSEFGIFGR